MSLIFREGVLLSVAPVVAYVTAWMFEVGYAEMYGVSTDLIEIDLKAILISLAVSLVALVPFLAFCGVFLYLGFDRSRTSRWWAIQLVFFCFPTIGLYASSFNSRIAYLGLGLAVISLAISFSRVAWKARRVGWEAAFSEAADAEGIKDLSGGRPAPTPTTFLNVALGVLFFLVVVMMFLFMVKGVGGRVAVGKEDFSTLIMDGKSYVILAGYGDRFVLGGISENKFDGNTYVIPKNSEKIVNLKNIYYRDFYYKAASSSY
ncbi:hypothetical protein [Pseudomonas syringae pv. coryli]|uniref:hypothetical protein n=1 Tax=Pseudomonas syringae pv. coryli TaxID=317659 RepID=UPI003D2D826D